MSTTAILMLALYRSQGADLPPVRLAAVTDLTAFKSVTARDQHGCSCRLRSPQLHLSEDSQLTLTVSLSLLPASYFTKSSVLEHLTFGARTVIQRTAAGTRQSVNLTEKAANHVVHTYVRNDGLSGVIVTQKDYSERVAYSLLNKTMSDWDAVNLDSSWKKSSSDAQKDQAPDTMKKDILLYQKPAEADKLLQIQKHLISIKEIMHKNIGQTQKAQTHQRAQCLPRALFASLSALTLCVRVSCSPRRGVEARRDHRQSDGQVR